MQSYDTNYKIRHADLAYGRKLGEGGFGEVFEGEWQHSQVAIKKLKMQKLSQEASQELETEAKMMAELRHDNIVGFRGFCFESPNYALVMEYMPRGSLYDLLHSSQAIDWASRVQISIGACAGLVYLHNKNILHRDIKSLNVLLYDRGNEIHAKLTDFGLSKVKTDTKLTTSTAKNSSGTLAWMAPELFARRAKYEKASDIYSFAVMLWEMASRRVPFEDAHDPGLIPGWVKDGEREEIPEGTPELLKETIQLGWKQETKDRPTAEQIVSSLKFLMQSLPRPTQSSVSPSPNPSPNPHPQPMSGLQGNYISGAVKQPMQPAPKQPPVANSFQGNLMSKMPNLPTKPLPTRPTQASPQPRPAANFSGIANNLQTGPDPSPKLPTEAEVKLAQQQAEIESLKNSMDALVKMKEREERKKQRKEAKKKQKKQERLQQQHAEAEQLKNQSFNERVNAKAASLAANVTPAAVTELLTHTVRGDLDNVQRCLQNNLALAYAQGDITDSAGRAFKKITAFQYAVWALDKEMWQLLLTVLPLVDAYDQLNALEQERLDIIKTHGAHFSFDPLLNAYKRYLDNWKAWNTALLHKSKHSDAMSNCWCKEVGGAQRMMPAWFIYLFSEKGTDKAWPTGQVEKPFARTSDDTWNRGVGKSSAASRGEADRALGTHDSLITDDSLIPRQGFKIAGKFTDNKAAKSHDSDSLAKLKSARARELAELTDQLSQAALNPSSSLRFGKQ